MNNKALKAFSPTNYNNFYLCAPFEKKEAK